MASSWKFIKQKIKNKNEVCLSEIELEDLNAHFQALYHSFIFNLSFSGAVISLQVNVLLLRYSFIWGVIWEDFKKEKVKFHLFSLRVHEKRNTMFQLNVFIEQSLAEHISPVAEKTKAFSPLLLCYLENE